MIPIGYMYKRVAARPGWLGAPQVQDVYSLSGCISEDFADYINHWRHNGYWLFDSPSIMKSLAAEQAMSLEGLALFYYEAHEEEYDDTAGAWKPFAPEASFPTDVQVPAGRILEGFDVTSFQVRTSPECSPLSCNSLASELSTNAHCPFRSFEDARNAIESGQFENCEPGPYRIIAVYTVTDV